MPMRIVENNKTLIKFPVFEKPNIKSPSMTGSFELLSYLEGISRRTQRTIELLSQPCCICGDTTQVEMHHTNPLKGITKTKDYLKAQQIVVKRKQIPLCKKCHIRVHSGKYNGPAL
jgi:hypothetical protein